MGLGMFSSLCAGSLPGTCSTGDQLPAVYTFPKGGGKPPLMECTAVGDWSLVLQPSGGLPTRGELNTPKPITSVLLLFAVEASGYILEFFSSLWFLSWP